MNDTAAAMQYWTDDKPTMSAKDTANLRHQIGTLLGIHGIVPDESETQTLKTVRKNGKVQSQTSIIEITFTFAVATRDV